METLPMFTTKYMKNQPKKRVKRYEEGGSVSKDKDMETIRDPNDGSVMLVRKGTSPQDYYGVKPSGSGNGKLGHAGAMKIMADIHRENKSGKGSSLPRYVKDDEDDD
jgi:hypothetical protein